MQMKQMTHRTALAIGAGLILLFSGGARIHAEDKVLARGDGFVVTEADISAVRALAPEGIKVGEEELLRMTLTNRLLAREAEAAGLAREPGMEKRLQVLREKTIADAYWSDRYLPSVKVEDDVLKSYYEAHVEEFTVPAGVHLMAIYVTDEARAKDIVERVGKGEDFRKIASQEQLNLPVGRPKTDLGWVSVEKLPPEWRPVVENLAAGQASAPIPSDGLYHVLFVSEKRDARLKPFSEVEKGIRDSLVMKKQKELMDQEIASLKQKYHVSEE